MSKLYRIRKLVWEQSADPLYIDGMIGDEHQYSISWTPSGAMWKAAMRYADWHKADSVDAAKLAAEAHWVSRVESCLEEVPQ